MKRKKFILLVVFLAVILLGSLTFLVSNGAAQENTVTISPSVVTVAFAHSYNGTTNVQGSAFNLNGADAELQLEGGVAFCFDTSLSHMPQGSGYQFLGLAQDYTGEWDVEKAYGCIMAAEKIINKAEYRELSHDMKLFAVQVAVRKQQPFGPYSGVQATASADVVCTPQQSQLMISLVNEIVNTGLSGNWTLPDKQQKLELVQTGGGYYQENFYILAIYRAKEEGSLPSGTQLSAESSEAVEAVINRSGEIVVRIPRDKLRGTVHWNIEVSGTVRIKTMLLFSPSASGYQRIVTLQSYAVSAEGHITGSQRFVGLTINKKDGDTGHLIADTAVFRIQCTETGEYIRHNGKTELATVNGQVILPEILPPGQYLIEEIQAPAGYFSGEPLRIQVPDTLSVDIENVPQKGSICIEKKGPVFVGVRQEMSEYGPLKIPVFEDRGLEGVSFRIENESGEFVETLVTDGKGRAQSGELPLGTYFVKESSGLPGYFMDSDVYEAVLTGTEPVKELSLYNGYQGMQAEITKTAEIWVTKEISGKEEDRRIRRNKTTAPGEGFVFGLYAGEDYSPQLQSGDLIAVGKSDGSGKVPFNSMLPVGHYYICELEAKPGYYLDQTRYELDLHRQTVISFKAINRLKVFPVQISKRNFNGEVPLQGAVIEIYDNFDNLLYREATGVDGLLTGIELSAGNYIFREVLAPEGYASYTEDQTFTVEEDGRITGVQEIRNEPVRFEGQKTDSNGQPLADAVFTLYNQEGQAVMTAISDREGKFIFEGFLRGVYTIRETQAPHGYLLSEDVYTFNYSGQWINGTGYSVHTWTNENSPTPEPSPEMPIPRPSPEKRVKAPDTGEESGYTLFVLTTSLAIMGIVALSVVIKRKE